MLTLKYFFKSWIFPILISISIIFLINKFLFFKIIVPSASMLPTIKVNDNIFVSRIYNFNSIKRGDILVFYSNELHLTLIKRVIGLPSDKVEIKSDGVVLINRLSIKETYVKNFGGKTGSFNVPDGKYFFLGDNRSNSIDARYWKNSYISSNDIKGIATVIVFPFNQISLLK